MLDREQMELIRAHCRDDDAFAAVRKLLEADAAAQMRRLSELEQQIEARPAAVSDLLYRLLTEHTSDLISLHELDGSFVYASPSFVSQLGYTYPELMGMPAEQLIREDDREWVMAATTESMQAGAISSLLEFHMLTKSGDSIWVEASLKFIPNTQGTVSRLLIYARNTTERHAAQLALAESEARFRGAFERSPIGIALVALDGRWLRVNRSLCDILGYTQVELLALDFQSLTYPEDLAADLALLEQTLAGAIDEYRLEKRYIHKHGHIIWALLGVSLVRDTAGDALYFVSQVQDISALKQVTESFRQSEERLQSILDSIQDLVYSVSAPSGRMLFVNPAVEDIYGYPARSFRDNPEFWIETTHPDDQHLLRAAAAQLLESGRWEAEYRVIRPTGEIHWLHNRAWLVRDQEKEMPLRVDGIVQDITARKVAHEQAFALALERERTRILTQFIQDASHEYRTPLSLIATNLFLLTRSEDSDLRQGYAQTIRAQVDRITDLTEVLLYTARLDMDEPDQQTLLELNQLLAQVLENCAADSAAKALDLRLQQAPEPIQVMGESSQLYRAVANLLHNSIRYTPPGGSVTVSVYADSEQAVVEVADTGIGMSPETVCHIFKSFWRADQAHTSPGLGLGLSIARRIAEHHHGTITVESNLGAGSIFRIVLPRARHS